jgi:hypothetical protein
MRLRLHVCVALLALVLLAPTAARAVPIGSACQQDTECDAGSICDQHVCTALPNRRHIFPFYFHQPGEVGYRHITPLLYFSTWNRGNEVQVQVPFFVHTHDADSKTDSYVIPPLLTHWRTSPVEKTFRFYPFFWFSSYKGDAPGVQSAFIPLYWYKGAQHQKQLFIPILGSGFARDDAQDKTLIGVGFLGWYYRHRDLSTWRIVAPLYFDHSTPEGRTIFAPLPLITYFHFEEHKGAGTVFPLLWHTRDDERDVNRWLLLPIFDYESDHHGHRRRVFSLIGGWEKDDDAKIEQLVLFAPPIVHRRDPVRDFDVVPPFFARWKVHEDDSTGFIAGNVYHSSDPEGSTTSVFPLYWGFHDRRTGAATHILAPLGGWHHGPGLTAFAAGPVFGWNNKNGEGSSAFGVAPLVLFHSAGTRYQQLILPLFARYGDHATGHNTTWVGPSYVRTTPQGWDVGLVPALFFGARKGGEYVYLPPLFHYRSPEKSVDVVGPAYYSRSPNGWAAGLAPLAMFGKHDGVSHQLVLPPLFVRVADERHDRESMLIGPYYHKRVRDSSLDVLFPLMYLARTPRRATLISPLAYWSKAPGRETLWVGPWLDRRDDVTHSRTRMLFPLLLLHDAPNYSVTVATPFFWRVRDGAETDTALFPFWWRIRGPERSLDAVFPLFVHTKTKSATTTLAGPFWLRDRADGGRSMGLIGLFAYQKTAHHREASEESTLPEARWTTSWLGGPGFFRWTDSQSGSDDTWAGPFYLARKPEGYSAGIVPLAFWWRRGTDSRALAPLLLFYHQHDAAADRALTVAGPLYFGHDGPIKRFGFAPLFFARKDEEKTSVVMPLLGFLQLRKYGSAAFTWFFGYSKYPTGYRFYVGPFYHRNDELTSSTALWPLAYFTRDKKTGSVIRYAFPFYFDGRGEDGRELQVYTPLIWRYHSVERTITAGLPLYLDVNVFGESHTTAVLPFAIRHDSKVSDSTQYIFPPILAWGRTRRGADPGRDAVVFPIVWRFGGKDPSTVVFPMWWDFKHGDDRTTVLFPLGALWTRYDKVTHAPESTHVLVLNCYYRRWYGSDREPEKKDSWYVSVYPLFDFGHPRHGDLEWNVVEGLIGYRRAGINRQLRLFWLFDIPFKPSKGAPVSWFTNSTSEVRAGF